MRRWRGAKPLKGQTGDLFDLQKRLATLLGNAIADQTPAGERAEPAAAITSSDPAQIAYWKGRALLDRRDLTGNIQAALKEFETAVAADPNFAIGLRRARRSAMVDVRADQRQAVGAARRRVNPDGGEARTRSPQRALYRPR